MGGITLAYEVARQLGATAIFTGPVHVAAVKHEIAVEREGVLFEKVSPADMCARKIGQELKRFDIPEGATVLFVEDVITTGKSTKAMIWAVLNNAHPSVIPLRHVLCLVNCSGLYGLSLAYGPDETALTEYMPELISLANV